MLVRKRISLGMILKIDGFRIALLTAIGVCVYWLHHFVGIDINIPLSVVATLGTAVAILLGFKNNSAYDRWWEARKIWGGFINQSRYLASQLVTYIDKGDLQHSPDHKQLLRELVSRHLHAFGTRGVACSSAWTKPRCQESLIDDPELRLLAGTKTPGTFVLLTMCPS